MANSNQGIGGFLPFPTFGGGEGGGGVTPVKMPASQMRFPTARAPASRRSVKPTIKETLSPFLPLALEGIMGMLSDEPQPMSDAEFLDSKNLNILENPTTLKEVKSNEKALAQLSAYNLFGDREEQEGFGLSDIAQMVVGSQMGRGAGDYAATYGALRKAKETARLNKNTNRAAYMTKALEEVDNMSSYNFEDLDAAMVGVPIIRTGFSDGRGNVYVQNDDKSGYENINNLPGRWIRQTQVTSKSLVDQFEGPIRKQLVIDNTEQKAKDSATGGALVLVNSIIKQFDEDLKDPNSSALTTISKIGANLNSVADNFLQLGSILGRGGNVQNLFAGDVLEDRSGGSSGRVGSGILAKNLYNALQTPDEADDFAAMEALENSGVIRDEKGNESTFRELLGDTAYSELTTRSTMLQLAYTVAAVNGQTGRTLSDKDLAFHLEMVGFGGTQSSQTARDNLLNFSDIMIERSDAEFPFILGKNALASGQYNLADPLTQGLVGAYYGTPTKMIQNPKDPKGPMIEVPDWSDPMKFTYKGFFDRAGDMPHLKVFRGHERRAARLLRERGSGSTGGGSTGGGLRGGDLDDQALLELLDGTT